MKTTHTASDASCSNAVLFTSRLFLLALSVWLGACSVDSSEVASAEELPNAGAIDIVQPLTLAKNARVPEREPGFISADVEPTRLVLTYHNGLPSFVEGDVLGGTQGGGYLVKVVRAHVLD